MARLSFLLAVASAALSKAAFLIDGPSQLVACEDATYNWTGGAAPYDIHLGRTVIADERVLRTSKETTWLVNYPAGALLNIRIDSGSAGSPNYAYAGSMVVQAGTDTSCIPPENANITIVSDPVSFSFDSTEALPNSAPSRFSVLTSFPSQIEFTTIPTRLQACESSTFSWTGGTAPYTLMFLALNSAGMFSEYTVRTAHTYNWEVNFPVGSTVYLNIAGSDYLTTSAPSYSKTYYVYNGTTDSCVPSANVNASISEPPPTPVVVANSRSVTLSTTATATGLFTGNRSTVSSSLSGGAIAGIIVGILVLLLIYLIYFLMNRRQKRAEKARGDVVGMQKLEGGSAGGSLEKVVPEGGVQSSASAVRSGLVPDLKMKGRAV